MTKEILIRFLNDQCSGEELAEVIRWIKDESLNKNSRNWGREDWRNFQVEKEYLNKEEFDLLLDKIHHKINIRSKTRKNLGSRYITWLTRAAAILLLPVLGILFYTLAQIPAETNQLSSLSVDSLEIVTPVGSQTVVQLSDGTEVHLNHGSKLQYPQSFDSKTREVILSGEGYFKVFHDPDRPFIVKTPELNIEALGTEFNVLAYPDENTVETTLIKGKVALEQTIKENNTKFLGTMTPGQHVEFSLKTKKLECTKGDIEKYIAWKDGRLIFKNESLVQITKRLSRWYNVEFDFKDSEIKEYTYTGTFIDETLVQILNLLKIATPITYKIVPRRKMPDGTYTKQQILLKHRD